MSTVYTLAIVLTDSHILLGKKKIGLGVGNWNGFGGKVEDGEEILGAAKRELEEEVGLRALNIRPAGLAVYHHPGKDQMDMHIFVVDRFVGEPMESEEMSPQWFLLDEIPYDQMWADDTHWLPLVLLGRKVHGVFHFDKSSQIEQFTLEEIE